MWFGSNSLINSDVVLAQLVDNARLAPATPGLVRELPREDGGRVLEPVDHSLDVRPVLRLRILVGVPILDSTTKHSSIRGHATKVVPVVHKGHNKLNPVVLRRGNNGVQSREAVGAVLIDPRAVGRDELEPDFVVRLDVDVAEAPHAEDLGAGGGEVGHGLLNLCVVHEHGDPVRVAAHEVLCLTIDGELRAASAREGGFLACRGRGVREPRDGAEEDSRGLHFGGCGAEWWQRRLYLNCGCLDCYGLDSSISMAKVAPYIPSFSRSG